MEELVRGTVSSVERIDKQIEAKAENWRLERMAVVDRNVLRLAIYELNQQILPPPIIIDEAIELARQFSSHESLSFINGILEAVRQQTVSASSSATPQD
jgi:N utilization substance protein B